LKTPEMIEHEIYSVDELMTIGLKHGISKLESYVSPISILYVDSTKSKDIIAIEFKAGFVEKHSQSSEHFYYNVPFYTEYLAENFNDKYAGRKLFEYYRNLPKFIKSDTIYAMYGGDFDKYLAILIKLNIKNLNNILKQDFYQWNKLSQKTSPKQYPTFEELRNRSFEESMKFNESDLYLDCSFISFQLAYALNLLNEPKFDDKFVEELKAKQTWTFIDRYKFPKVNTRYYNSGFYKLEIPLTKTYNNINELVLDSSFETFFIKNVEDCCEANITVIVHDNKLTGFVGISRNNGSDDYRIKLNNKTLIVETMSSIIE